VRDGIGDRVESVLLAQLNRVPERGGSFDQHQPVFERDGPLRFQSQPGHLPDLRQGDRPFRPRCEQPRRERGLFRNKAALEANIIPNGEVEDLAPFAVFQIPVDPLVHLRAEWSTDVVALSNPALLHELGMVIAHTVRSGCRAAGRGQLQGHVVAEVDGVVSGQEAL